MRIVIDLQGAQTQSRFRGIGRYSLSLAEALVSINHAHEILIILNSAFPEAISIIQKVFKKKLPESIILIFDVPKLISWENPNNEWKRNAAELIRESFIADLEPDVVLITSLFEGAMQCNAVSSLGRLEFPAIQSVILYDLIPLLNQKDYLTSDWSRSWYFNKLDHLKRADLLFSISEYTAKEAEDLLDLSTENIVNISPSHSKNFIPAELDLNAKTDLMSRLGIRKPYLMYNGAFEARKNLEGLMQAFSILPDEFRDSMQLVFAGKVSEVDVLMLQNLANSFGIQDALLLTGYVADEDLIALFSLSLFSNSNI
jgi:glycosyltransferase involved in cell wall biosynthesis